MVQAGFLENGMNRIEPIGTVWYGPLRDGMVPVRGGMVWYKIFFLFSGHWMGFILIFYWQYRMVRYHIGRLLTRVPVPSPLTLL